MKKLSKIVALLLAGAMAMVMLTACSGGGTTADTECGHGERRSNPEATRQEN